MSEPYIHEVPPQAPRYVERDVPLCPTCSGLARRDLGDPGIRPHGPWRCDLHGEVTPVWERIEVPTGYEEDAYELSDPKHPRHHEVYADISDARED
jgi:hypothetical protein